MKTDDILSTYAIQKNNKCIALEMYGRVRIEIQNIWTRVLSRNRLWFLVLVRVISALVI